jgi:hypothetical protein
MNTYFLSLLSKEKKRKRNRTRVIHLTREIGQIKISNHALEVGDIVHINLEYFGKYHFFFKGDNNFIEESYLKPVVPYYFKITDQKFNPYYWLECGLSYIHFSDEIVLRLISILKKKYEPLTKLKIGKTRYNFYCSKNPIDILEKYLVNHQTTFEVYVYPINYVVHIIG